MAFDKPCMEFVDNRLIIAIEPEFVEVVIQMAEQENIKIVGSEWQSKYNRYCVYKYEPFCTVGFICNIILSSKLFKLQWFRSIVLDRLENLKFLEKCLVLPSYKRKEEDNAD